MASSFTLTFRGGPAWVYNRYWLATLVRASYHPVANIHLLALGAAAGGWHGYADSGAAAGADLPLWFAARSGPRKVLVVLCGTLLPITYYGHITGGLGMVGGPWPGLAHGFWAAGGVALAAAIAAALGPLDKSDWHLTGHSWGGACAQTLAYALQQHYATGAVEIVTAGCPKVGNAAFAAGFAGGGPWLWQDQNPFDPVPHLPPPVNALFVGALAGGLLPNLQTYRHGGVRHRWLRGLGPAPQHSGGAGPLTGSFDALSALTRGYPSVRPHLAYYYALKWYREARLTAATFAAARAQALELGYDLDDLDEANAAVNALDGLPAVWPLPASLEP